MASTISCKYLLISALVSVIIYQATYATQSSSSMINEDVSDVVGKISNALYDFLNDPKISQTTNHVWEEFNIVLKSHHGSEVIRNVMDEVHLVLTDSTAHDAIEHVLDTVKVVLKNQDGVKVLIACMAGLAKIQEGNGIDSIHTITTGMSKLFADQYKRETIAALSKGLYEVGMNSR